MLAPAGEPSAARHDQALTAGRVPGEESLLRRGGAPPSDIATAERGVTVAAERGRPAAGAGPRVKP